MMKYFYFTIRYSLFCGSMFSLNKSPKAYFMNTIGNMNFSYIRKISQGVFAHMLNFWLITSIVFCVLMALLFACISPLSKKYTRICRNLEDLSSALERYTAKKDMYNESWIALKKQESEIYNKEAEKCKSFFRGKDDYLESVFMIQGADGGLVKVEDEALWKNEYGKRISAVLAKLGGGLTDVGNGALPFQNWGTEIPTWDNILSVQKRFWIIETIVNIVLNNHGITKLEKINFKESCCSYDQAFAHIYTAIPVTMKFELPADRIQFLLHDILRASIPFVIEGVTISSTGKIPNRDSSVEMNHVLNAGTNNPVPNPIAEITIDAYIIDYKT